MGVALWLTYQSLREMRLEIRIRSLHDNLIIEKRLKNRGNLVHLHQLIVIFVIFIHQGYQVNEVRAVVAVKVESIGET